MEIPQPKYLHDTQVTLIKGFNKGATGKITERAYLLKQRSRDEGYRMEGWVYRIYAEIKNDEEGLIVSHQYLENVEENNIRRSTTIKNDQLKEGLEELASLFPPQ